MLREMSGCQEQSSRASSGGPRGGTLWGVVDTLRLQLQNASQIVHDLLKISQSSSSLAQWMHGGQGAGHGETEVRRLVCVLLPSALSEHQLQPHPCITSSMKQAR